MKFRFILLVTLLLFSRGCDFYSTSLWFFQKNGIKDETNPLTRYFGVDWNGLVVVNIAIMALLIAGLYFFYFRYQRKMHFAEEPKDYRELASLQYFGNKHQFYKIYYTVSANRKVMYAHISYTFTIAIIAAGFMATFHNLCQFYDVSFYNRYREIVGKPLYVMYGLFGLITALAYRQLLKNEYNKYCIQRIKEV